MFSLFSKSSKGVAKQSSDEPVHKRNFSGSQGTLNTDREEIPSLSPYKNNQFEVRSSVSVNTNNSENKKYKKEKKKSRSRNFRGLFNSDCEDEINSVVSDNPQLYHRSSSMNTLGNNQTKKNMLMSKGRTFDKVEEKMNHIQASLSSSSLIKPETNNAQDVYNNMDDGMVTRLKKELEEKELLAKKLQDQLNGLKSKPLDSDSDLSDWEEQLNRKRRQIKKKKEQLRRIQDDGNIDVKISLAEMEYNMEKDQIEIMNLSQKIQSARMQNVKNAALKEIAKHDNLYRYVQNGNTTVLLACELEFGDMHNIGLRYEGFGLEVKEIDDTHDLSVGDRIIEVDGNDVLRIFANQWEVMQNEMTFPCKIVFMRMKESLSENKFKFDNSDVNGLKDDIALIQSRLSEKLKEGRHVSSELSAVQQEKEKLCAENTRLNHRIEYLEDQVNDLENGMKQVRDSLAQTLNTEILETIQKLDRIGKSGMTEAIFQKGGHVAHVQVPASADEQYSTSTSGIYSVEGSEGSNSPEYNSFRSRVTAKDLNTNNKRWSVGYTEDNNHIARLVVGEDPKVNENNGDIPINNYSIAPPPKPNRQIQGQAVNRQNLPDKYVKEGTIDTKPTCEKPPRKVERSNSRVTRVSNLIRWPRKQDKDKTTLSVSDYSQV